MWTRSGAPATEVSILPKSPRPPSPRLTSKSALTRLSCLSFPLDSCCMGCRLPLTRQKSKLSLSRTHHTAPSAIVDITVPANLWARVRPHAHVVVRAEVAGSLYRMSQGHTPLQALNRGLCMQIGLKRRAAPRGGAWRQALGTAPRMQGFPCARPPCLGLLRISRGSLSIRSRCLLQPQPDAQCSLPLSADESILVWHLSKSRAPSSNHSSSMTAPMPCGGSRKGPVLLGQDSRQQVHCLHVQAQAQAYALGVNQQTAIYGAPVTAGDGGVLLDPQGAPVGNSLPLPRRLPSSHDACLDAVPSRLVDRATRLFQPTC